MQLNTLVNPQNWNQRRLRFPPQQLRLWPEQDSDHIGAELDNPPHHLFLFPAISFNNHLVSSPLVIDISQMYTWFHRFIGPMTSPFIYLRSMASMIPAIFCYIYFFSPIPSIFVT
jgi:hypothetical protein